MFYAAGVFFGSLARHAEGFKPLGKDHVAFIDLFGNIPPFIRKSDDPVRRHGYELLFPHVFERNTNAGLGKSQLPGNVDGMRVGFLPGKEHDGLEVIL